jgi:hypothetical protein
MRIAVHSMKHTVHTEQGLGGATRDVTDRNARAIAAMTVEILPNIDDVSSRYQSFSPAVIKLDLL